MTTDRSTAADPQDHAARGRALIDRMRLGQADPLDVRRAAGLRYRPAVVACEMMGLEPEIGIEVPEAYAASPYAERFRGPDDLFHCGIAVAACMEAIFERRGRMNLARAIVDAVGDDGAGLGESGIPQPVLKAFEREARGQILRADRYLASLWLLYQNVVGVVPVNLTIAAAEEISRRLATNARIRHPAIVAATWWALGQNQTHKPSTFASRLYAITIRTLLGERESILEDW